MTAPEEDEECQDGWCWLFKKAMYGLKDAGRAFDRLCEVVMEEWVS